MSDDEYEVDRIIAKRFNPHIQCYEYRIRWKGYTSMDDTWEPKENLTHCDGLLRDFDQDANMNAEYEKKILEIKENMTKIILNPKKSETKKLSLSKRKRPRSLEEVVIQVSKERNDKNHSFTFSISKNRNKEKEKQREKQREKDKYKNNSNHSINTIASAIRNDNHFRNEINRNSEKKEEEKENDQKNASPISKGEFDRVQKAILDNAMNRFKRMLSKNSSIEITAVNNKTLDLPPLHFTYMESYKYGENVPLPDEDFLTCCDCSVTRNEETGTWGICNTLSCTCVKLSGRFPYSDNGKLNGIEMGVKSSFNSYGKAIGGSNSSGGGRGRGIIQGPIYECNKKCKCNHYRNSCKNRLIQSDRSLSLSIEHMGDKRAWGVVSLIPIEAGTFIDQYFGEIVSNEMATERYVKLLGEDPKNLYLFDLDYNDEPEMESDFTVDAYKFGSVSRFFNHSCDPNLVIVPCFIDTHDPRLHSLAFFTSRAIKKGEELCFDYLGRDTEDYKFRNKRGSIKCYCGSKNCRGYVI